MRKIRLLQGVVLLAFAGYLPSLSAATCQYFVNSDWNTGFTSRVVIKNDTPEPISGWTVTWSFTDGASVAQVWNASLTGSNPYNATNLSYNGLIRPNAEVEFGFNGSKANSGAHQPPVLGGICGDSVNQAPTASATASTLSGQAPLLVDFDGASSTDPENDTLSYLWTFSDGSTANTVVAQKTFSTPGSYTATLVVNDGQADSAPSVLTITVADEPSDASFVLDATKSSLYFVSTKKTHVVETHSFATLTGSVESNGDAIVTIALDSVATGIPLRNERMRNLLFETGTFPLATARLSVDMPTLQAMPAGSSTRLPSTVVLSLHGVEQSLDVELIVSRLSASTVLVQSANPILIQAGDFGLEAGVEALRVIANLDVISYAVPVNVNLFFNAQ